MDWSTQENQMRTQTLAYVAAVIAAHPELNTVDMPPEKFDPYPLIPSEEPIHPRYIVKDVAKRHNIEISQILGDSRAWFIVRARHEAYWLCSKFSQRSYSAIARFFRRDHSTIIAGVRRHESTLNRSV